MVDGCGVTGTSAGLRRVFDEVFALEVVIAAFVFLVVLGALVFSVVHRRAGVAGAPSGRAERPRLELYYVAALAAVAVSLVLYTALANHREQRAAARPPAPGGWLGWITTTDHKRIGLLTAAGAAAGAFVCALVLRSNRHAPPPAHGAARTVRRTTG